MRIQQTGSRNLTEIERKVLSRALDLAEFQGGSELQNQVSHAVVTGGTEFVLDLFVVGEITPSSVGSGPIPTRVLARSDCGALLGEVIVWVADGYLSGLEYAWFTNDAPTFLPSADQLALAD